MGNLNNIDRAGASSAYRADCQAREESGLPPLPPHQGSETDQLMELVGEADHQHAARGLNGTHLLNGRDFNHQPPTLRLDFQQGRVASGLGQYKHSHGTNTIPTACEFPDVFAEKPPRMLPPRTVEFAIESKPGARPTSWPHPRMAPEESVQLHNSMSYN